MTPEQVIVLADRKARELGLKWRAKKAIRCSGKYLCPLAVAADPYGDIGWPIAGQQLGLTEDDVIRIMNAADGSRIHDETLRALMLATFEFVAPDAGGGR